MTVLHSTLAAGTIQGVLDDVLVKLKGQNIDLVSLVAGLITARITMKLFRLFTLNMPSGIFVPSIESRSPLAFLAGHSMDIRSRPAYEWHNKIVANLPKYHLFAHRMFLMPRVVVTHPGDLEYILYSGAPNFGKAKTYKTLGKLIGHSILTHIDDDGHWAMRKEMGSAFSPQALKRIADITVKRQVSTMVEELTAVARQRDNRIDFNEMIMRITLRVIAEAAFATDKEACDKASLAFVTINRAMTPWAFFPGFLSLPTAGNRTFWKNRHSIDRIIQETIKKVVQKGKPAEGEQRTLADYLVFSKLLTPRDVSENALTVMFAGHETTSTALTWVIYILCKYPDVQEKLYEELCSVMGKGAVCGVDDLKNCRYLHCVVKESLRLYPPASQISRITRRDIVLPGSKTFVPKGNDLECCIFLVQRDPATWGADAEEFKPERWEDPALEGKLTEVSWMPFSIGRRNCIGKDFAMNELVLLLAALARNFKWEWPADEPDVVRGHTIVLRPKQSYKVALFEREN